MSDQDDFSFEEQDSDSEEWYEEEPEKKKKKSGGSRGRLLFLLLLVAIAGGAYFFLMMPQDDGGPAAPPKAVVSVKKKTVAMPARQKISKPAPAPAENGKMAEKASGEQSAEMAAKGPTPVKMPVAAEPKPVQKQQAPAPVATKVAAVPAPVPVKPGPESTKQVFEKPEAMVADVVDGAYSLTAGTYLLDSSVKSVSKKIRALGYEPVLTPVKRKVTLTRLKLGSYSHAGAAAKKAELKSIAPGVFGIRKGDKETVYVGSYAVLDKARRFADSLYAKGIKVEEEPVQVVKTLQRVTFGSFADSAAATTAGRQAAAKGVEAKVIKNR